MTELKECLICEKLWKDTEMQFYSAEIPDIFGNIKFRICQFCLDELEKELKTRNMTLEEIKCSVCKRWSDWHDMYFFGLKVDLFGKADFRICKLCMDRKIARLGVKI